MATRWLTTAQPPVFGGEVSLANMLTYHEITSPLFVEPRSLWVQRSQNLAATRCVILLDAELYLQRVHAPQAIHQLEDSGELAGTNIVYLSSLSAAARHADYTCHERFSEFLATELRSWIEEQVGLHARYYLCGLSLSGLCAAFTAWKFPSRFAGAICQSPSAWWNEEWLTTQVTTGQHVAGRYWISVGDQEVESDVTHPPSGLYQGATQLASCVRLTSVLKQRGADTYFAPFHGGHDCQCWSQELPAALVWLLKD